MGWAACATGALALWSCGWHWSSREISSREIANGAMWNGSDEAIRWREIWLYGVPLLLATAGSVALGWTHRRKGFATPDPAPGLCGATVATDLITTFRTAISNATGARRSRPSAYRSPRSRAPR